MVIKLARTSLPGVYIPGELNQEESEAVDRFGYDAAISLAPHTTRNSLGGLELSTSNKPQGRLHNFAEEAQAAGIAPTPTSLKKFAEQRGEAFTLIELLVVVAIIAILAAMALPGLQNAKNRGKAAVCLSNQHQIYLAARMYADENQDKLPIGDLAGAPLNDAADPLMFRQASLLPANIGTYLYYKYIADPNAVWCPQATFYTKDNSSFGMVKWGNGNVIGSMLPRNNSGVTIRDLKKLSDYKHDNALLVDNNRQTDLERYSHLLKYVVITYGDGHGQIVVDTPPFGSFSGGSQDLIFEWADKQAK